MKITKLQLKRISGCLPTQRGNVKVDNLRFLNAILYVVENSCKWRALPKHFGNWNTIYRRMSYWAKTGILTRVFKRLQQEQLLPLKINSVSLD
jgi:transposase